LLGTNSFRFTHIAGEKCEFKQLAQSP